MRKINGESCKVQGYKSDVILHVPNGVYGTLHANIHTDPADFIHHIPKQSCLVAPICEYHLQPAKGHSEPQNVKYKIQIPHIVADIERVRHHLTVHHGNIYSRESHLNVEKQNSPKYGLHYDIDDKYITIYTSHFSGFIVTADRINCCAKNANVLIFGSLRNYPEARPLSTLKVIFASNHVKCKDVIEVSISVLHFLAFYQKTF